MSVLIRLTAVEWRKKQKMAVDINALTNLIVSLIMFLTLHHEQNN